MRFPAKHYTYLGTAQKGVELVWLNYVLSVFRLTSGKAGAA